MAKREILLCTGSHCRKALRKHGQLEGVLERLPVAVTRVGCQKVCRGPLVGITIEGQLEWFERMRTRKAAEALALLVEHGELAKRLEKRRNASRSGRRRS